MGVAQDRRTCGQGGARGFCHARRELDILFQADHACSVDHAHGDAFLILVEPVQIGLCADGCKALGVDGGAVGFVAVEHLSALCQNLRCRAQGVGTLGFFYRLIAGSAMVDQIECTGGCGG